MNGNNNGFIATHTQPVWRKISDTLFHAYIGFANERNEWEQLWGKSLSSSDVLVCCIPFFTYGLSLGDRVRIDEDGNFIEITKKSDQITIRVWFVVEDFDRKRKFLCELEKIGVLREFYSKNLLAMSTASAHMNEVKDLLERLQNVNFISYELG